ncbi:MAG TPA: MBL fold metallo-hydrolase [Longimicrobiaceae bacterium]|nr:MBL fold metallo-hydrolase [Longimicrobiaceae bacterium]
MNRAFAVALALLCAACTHHLDAVQDPGRAVAFSTGFPWSSVIYAARVDGGGVVLVDLGWYGSERALRRELRRLGAHPEQVTDVFLTHSHRDHIGAWRVVRTARFHLGAGEQALFEGRDTHRDLPSRVGEVLLGNPAPWAGEIAIHPFTTDTAFVFGADTVRAFPNPGHTEGSAAYLFRGVLFVGDAVSRKALTGFGGAEPIFTADDARARESLRSLFRRAEPYRPQWVCSAHGKCARPDSAFVRRVTGSPP